MIEKEHLIIIHNGVLYIIDSNTPPFRYKKRRFRKGYKLLKEVNINV